MRNAQECSPKKCNCGAKLGKPVYGYPWLNEKMLALHTPFEWPANLSPIKEKVWHVKCNKCDNVYVWSYHEKSNSCWKLRQFNPLFDSEEIVVVA